MKDLELRLAVLETIQADLKEHYSEVRESKEEILRRLDNMSNTLNKKIQEHDRTLTKHSVYWKLFAGILSFGGIGIGIAKLVLGVI